MSIAIRPFQYQERRKVIELWRKCGLIVPTNDPHKDIDCKMQMGSEFFLVGLRDNKVVAVIMGGYEGHRGAIIWQLTRSGWGRGMGEAWWRL